MKSSFMQIVNSPRSEIVRVATKKQMVWGHHGWVWMDERERVRERKREHQVASNRKVKQRVRGSSRKLKSGGPRPLAAGAIEATRPHKVQCRTNTDTKITYTDTLSNRSGFYESNLRERRKSFMNWGSVSQFTKLFIWNIDWNVNTLIGVQECWK